MPAVLITGASRGLGLEFARQYAADGWRVHACCRAPDRAANLRLLADARPGQVEVHALDVDDDASVAACAEALGDAGLDLVLCNAGIHGERGAGYGNMDYASFAEVLNTNVIGAMRAVEAFGPKLSPGGWRKLVAVSSRMGSIEQAAGNSMIYRTSKAALNMLMRCLSLELGQKGIVTVAVHPGWVRTDMGGPHAALSPEESVRQLRALIARLKPGDNGGFFNHDGSPIPW